MYQNESFDEYIRSILGYPSLNNMQMQSIARNEMFDYFDNNHMTSIPNEDTELEECYPEIYKLVYPMIVKRCSQVSEPITKEIVSNITDEIYNVIEGTNEVNVNINLKNEITNNRNQASINSEETKNKSEITNEYQNVNATNKIDNRQEDRHFNNGNLRDLIKILIIRELLRKIHDRGAHFPSRPQFPGGGIGLGRPTIMPRNSYLDLY